MACPCAFECGERLRWKLMSLTLRLLTGGIRLRFTTLAAGKYGVHVTFVQPVGTVPPLFNCHTGRALTSADFINDMQLWTKREVDRLLHWFELQLIEHDTYFSYPKGEYVCTDVTFGTTRILYELNLGLWGAGKQYTAFADYVDQQHWIVFKLNHIPLSVEDSMASSVGTCSSM